MSTPLNHAVTDGRLAEVRELVPSAPVEEVEAALFTAVIYGHVEIVNYLLDAGVDVNARSKGQHSDESTPLFYATGRGLELTRLLLDRGARADLVTKYGADPLSTYIQSFAPGHRQPPVDLELVDLLLRSGVDMKRERAPDYLLAACWSGDAKLVSFLIARGCDPNKRGKGDHDLLWKAVSQPSHSKAVLAALVEGGLDGNARLAGVFDETALMEVCGRGDIGSARLLLQRGADPNVLTKRGTALTRAQESGNPAIVDLLLEHGAKPLVGGLEATVLNRLDAAEREARARPREAQTRMAWGEALLGAGFRAAGVRELQAARLLGADPHLPQLENPAGVRWAFVPFSDELSEVSPRVSDGRFPSARLTDGKVVVPLPVWLGPACTRCDEKGEVECATCNGTGGYSSMFSDDDVPCDPRAACYACLGLKFEVDGQALGKGECKHPAPVQEHAWPRARLMRCPACGLSGLNADHGRAHHVWTRWACAVCERLQCTCPRG